jgi:CRP-like cAMP-binding protein
MRIKQQSQDPLTTLASIKGVPIMEMPVRPTSGFNLPRYLSMQPLFQEMSPTELERLAQGCTLRRWRAATWCSAVGEPCEAFHVTVTGQVKLFAISPRAGEGDRDRGPGQSFAEALMFTNRPYIVNAQALTDSLVLSVGKAAVVTEIEHDPRFAMRMLAGISRRLHGLVHDVQSLCAAQRRAARHRLPAARPGRPKTASAARCVTVSLPVSKATIASRLSLTPEYFSRVLHELEAAVPGLVRIDKRDVHILDVGAAASVPQPSELQPELHLRNRIVLDQRGLAGCLIVRELRGA